MRRLSVFASLAILVGLAGLAHARSGRWDNDGYIRHDSKTPAPSISAGGTALSAFEDPDGDGQLGADMDGATEVIVGPDNCSFEYIGDFGGGVGTATGLGGANFLNSSFAAGSATGSVYVCEDGIATRFSDVHNLIPINRALPDIRFDYNLSMFPYWDDLTTQAGASRSVLVTVVTAANSTLYTVSLDGSDYLLMSDASATATEIRDGLSAAINFAGAGFTATAVAANTFTIAADDPADNEFALYVDSNLSAAQTAAGADRSIIRVRPAYDCGGNFNQRCATIEWRAMTLESNPAARLTFQLTLLRTGEFRFHYLSMTGADGGSATVGALNDSLSSWNTYSYNTAGTISSGLVVSFGYDGDNDGLSDAFEDANQDGSLNVAAVAQVVNVSVIDTRNDTDYTVSVNGIAFSFTSDATATNTEIRDGLIALVNANAALPVTASAGGAGDFNLTADAAGTAFGYSASLNLDAGETTANATVETDPNDNDTDGDNEWDGGEVAGGTNPLLNTSPAAVTDADLDLIGSLSEAYFGTKDTLVGGADSDGDGMDDIDELQWGNPPRDPAFNDSDQDGQPDGFSRPEWDVVVSAAVNNTLYTVTIDGTAYHFTSGGAATLTEIRDGLGFFLEAAGFVVNYPAADTLSVQGTDDAVTSLAVTETDPNLTVAEQTNVDDTFDGDERDPTDVNNNSFSTNGTPDVATVTFDKDGNIHIFTSDQNSGYGGIDYIMVDRWGQNELISATNISGELVNSGNVENTRAFNIPGTNVILLVARHETGFGDGLGLLRIEPGRADQDGSAANPEEIVTMSSMLVASAAHEFDLFVDASGTVHVAYELWFDTQSGGREDVGYELHYLRADGRTGRVLSDAVFYTEAGGDGHHKKGRPHVVVSGGTATILFKLLDLGAHIVRMSGGSIVSEPKLAHVPGEHEDLAFAGGALLSGIAGGEMDHYPGSPNFLVTALNPGGGISAANVIDERFDDGNTHVEAASVGSNAALFSWNDDSSGEFRWVLVDSATNIIGMPMVKDEGTQANDKSLYNSTAYFNGKIVSVGPDGCCNVYVQVRNVGSALPSAYPLAPTTRQNIMTGTAAAVTAPAASFGAGGAGTSPWNVVPSSDIRGGGGGGGCELGSSSEGASLALLALAVAGLLALRRKQAA